MKGTRISTEYNRQEAPGMCNLETRPMASLSRREKDHSLQATRKEGGREGGREAFVRVKLRLSRRTARQEVRGGLILSKENNARNLETHSRGKRNRDNLYDIIRVGRDWAKSQSTHIHFAPYSLRT